MQYNFEKMEYYKTPKCLLMYEHLFNAKQNQRTDGSIDHKFEIVLLIPQVEAQKDPGFIALWNAIQALAHNKAPGQQIFLPIKDGNLQYAKDNVKYLPFKDCYSIVAKNKYRPLVGNQGCEEVSESLGNMDQIYRGCFIWAKVKPWFVHNKNFGTKSIGLDLGNVQKVTDGAPLFNKRNIEDDFEALPQTGGTDNVNSLSGVQMPGNTGMPENTGMFGNSGMPGVIPNTGGLNIQAPGVALGNPAVNMGVSPVSNTLASGQPIGAQQTVIPVNNSGLPDSGSIG